MPLYRYGPDSLIDEVAVFRNETGGKRAYLHARADATPEQLGEAIKNLMGDGLFAVPHELDGKPVLEVRSFKDSDDRLSNILCQNHLTTGKAEISELTGDRMSFASRLKNNTLMVSAIAYLLGDFCMIRHGRIKEQGTRLTADVPQSAPDEPHNHLMEYSGYAYSIGSTSSLVSMLVRKDRSELEISSASKKILDHLTSLGVGGDQLGLTQAAQSGERSLLQKAQDYFGNRPAELMNLPFSAAGGFIFSAAKTDYDHYRAIEKRQAGFLENDPIEKAALKQKKINAAMDMVLGPITTVSGIASSFIRERAGDPDHKPANLMESIRERPLKLAGAGYMVSTLIHLASSLSERQVNEKLVRHRFQDLPADQLAQKIHSDTRAANYRLAFVVLNLVAETLMFFSHKGHGEGIKADQSVNDSLSTLVANAIVKQPAAVHKDLTREMSEFMAMPDVIGGKPETIEKDLTARIAALQQNPWSQSIETANRQAPPPATWSDRVSKAEEPVAAR